MASTGRIRNTLSAGIIPDSKAVTVTIKMTANNFSEGKEG
jgi:hypothetical protein